MMRRGLLVLAMAVCFGLIGSGQALASGTQVAHDQYGYPYPNAPDCDENGSAGCVLDTWRFYQGQCTSWVAYRLNQLNGIGFTDFYGGAGAWGDAADWGAHARGLSIAVNGTPAIGSVAWYSSGHVAYVEAVNSPTSVVISEMNGDFHNSFSVHTITTAGGWPSGFIHIHDRPSGTPRGNYDSASSPTAGMLHVTGWDFDPDAPTASIPMHVYVGGQAGQPGTEGHAFTADASRPDVAAAYPGVGNAHGLDVTFETGLRGAQPVCVYAINGAGGGDNVLLACQTVTIANPNPYGSFDGATSPAPGQVRVGGWSVDPNDPTAPLPMHVYVGGTVGQPGIEGHAFTANASRPDVAAVYPGVGNSHGLDQTFTTALTGAQPVCLYAINTGAGANVFLGCKTLTIAPAPAPSPPAPGPPAAGATPLPAGSAASAPATPGRPRVTKVVRRNRTTVAVTVACAGPGGCPDIWGFLMMKTPHRHIELVAARNHISLSAGHTATFRLRLNGRARAQLRSQRRLRVEVLVHAADGSKLRDSRLTLKR